MRATKPDGTTSTVTTSATGSFTFSAAAIPAATKVRLDFLVSPTDFDSPVSANSGTSVQFVTAPSTTADLGLIATTGPDQFFNPCIVSSCFTAVTNPADAAIITFRSAEVQDAAQPFVNGSGAGTNQFARKSVMTERALATQGQVGTINGLTYHTAANTLLAAAFVRNAGNMPQGSGAIYKIVNPNSATPTVSLLTTISGTGSLSVANSVGTEALTGYAGLGDLALSADQTVLYTVNLNTRALVAIPLSGTALTAGTPTVRALPVPAVVGTAATDFHPLGLGIKNGKLYVALTCGKLGFQAGYIYEYDGTAFTLKLTIPFTYTRAYRNANYYGYSGYPQYIDNNDGYVDWGASLAANYLTDFNATQANPKFQPWVADIDFDGNDMIIGVRSRLADARNGSYWVVGGDILRACSTDGVNWTLENNGTCGTKTTAPVPAIDPYTKRAYTGTFNGFPLNTNSGPGGSEYYWGDDGFEGEASQGAVLMLPGYSDVLTSQVDAIGHTGQIGVMAMSNTTGAITSAGNIFFGEYGAGNQISKSNGLGALTYFPNPATVEIGNRIWQDDNRNGIQDPTEAGIPNVTVTLYKSNTLIATAVTNSNGEYYFSSSAPTAATTAAGVYNLTALTAGSVVQLELNLAQAAISSLTLTTANQGTNDAIDSDFAPSAVGSTTAVATVTLGSSGANMHTFDAGLYLCPTITFTAPAANTQYCGNGTATFTVSTNAVASDGVRLVAFTTETDPYSTTTGAVFSTSVVSSTATGTKTFTFSNVQLPDNLTGANTGLFVYAVLVSANGTCQPVDDRIITLKPRPNTVIGGPAQVCTGSTATLSANAYNGASYQWFYGSGTTAISTSNPYTTTAINAASTYRVRVTLNSCVSDDASFTVTPVPCNACTVGPTGLGGKVYHDFDGDGTADANDLNLSGITVTLFRCDATSQSTLVTTLLTDLNGAYSFTGLTAGTTYRVEFSNLPAGYQPTYRGSQNGTTVQFSQPGSCSVSLGLNQAGDFCQTNPLLVTPCYLDGAVTPNTTGATDVLVGITYDYANMYQLGTRTQIGSTWGVAYARTTKKLYSAAFLKRHVGLKDGNLGQIYITDLSTSPSSASTTTTAWLNVSALVGGNWQFATDAQRGLGNAGQPSLDAQSFSVIAGIGLGDIDISDDEKTLYVMDLTNRQLLAIDIATKTLTGKYPVPELCSTGSSTSYFSAGSGNETFTANDGKQWQKGYLFDITASSLAYAQTITNPNNAAAGTSDAALYANSAYTSTTMAYGFPVGNGTFGVKLHLASNGPATSRNMTVLAEGVAVPSLTNFDTYAQAGGVNIGITRSFTTTVTDGVLSLSITNNAGSSYATVSGFELTTLNGTPTGVTRPFALAVQNGNVYVGAICDASHSQSRDDLQASVLVFDPVAGTYNPTPVLTFPLTYTKGPNWVACSAVSQWHPWTSIYPNSTASGVNCAGFTLYTQPTLSDIEFDVDGTMILAFFDRFQHQQGAYPSNYTPDGRQVEALGAVGGELLRAYFNGTSYKLEYNGKEGPTSPKPATSGQNDGDGIGGGEFYVDNTDGHHEISAGGLAFKPGSGEIRVSVGDPLVYNSGGITGFDNTTGAKQNGYTLYAGVTGGTQNKANGLGDLEVLCDVAPIQIGNRVWRDDNRNGIQDPCEPAIPGAVVTLYNAAKTTAIASVTTNAAGEYYFASTTITAGNSSSSVATTALTYNTVYGLVITSLGTSTVVTGLSLTSVSPVTPGESGTANSGTTQINNDARVDVVGGISRPCIKLTTGGPGDTNHTYDFGLSPAPPCSLSLVISRSNCDPSTNLYTVTGTVDLTNAPGGTLTVQDGTIATTISVSANQPTATFSFSGLISDATSHTITATLVGCSSAVQSYTAPASCLPVAPLCTNGLAGTVFNDFDNDGVKSGTAATGIPGVTVKVFDCQGNLLGTTITDQSGRYSFTATAFTQTANYPLRVEFSTYPAWARPTANGTDGRTDVQFVTAPDCNVDFGLTAGSDYCQSNPRLATSCYVNGTNGTDTPVDALVSWDYTASGTTGTTEKALSNKASIGSTWGLAYSSKRNRIYEAAFVKRHVGIGPGGVGAIYEVDPAGPVSGTLLTTIPNAGTLATNVIRGLGAASAADADPTAFSAVGRVGLGDMDMSEDQQSLYVVNLNDKRLYTVDIATKTVTGSVAIPDGACQNGESRPFGLNVHRDVVYVGVICDGSTSTTLNAPTSDMKAIVYAFNPATNTFAASPVLAFNLDYLRSPVWNEPTYGGATGMPRQSRVWYPWKSTFSQAAFNGYILNGAYKIGHATPILSDIEIDNDGSMILGFADRTSHQFGNENRAPDYATSNLLETNISGGDILRASPTGSGTWTIEPLSYARPVNATTPAETEFYKDEFFSTYHYETAQGGLALLLAKNEVVTTAMDPLAFSTGGTIKLLKSTGLQPANSAFQVFSGDVPFFGKASGLGDLVALCDPLPIQIGNRIWIDADQDGVQDPCVNEPGVANVTVNLYDNTGKLVGKTTTNTSGEYYFGPNNVAIQGVNATTGVPLSGTYTGMTPQTQYCLVFGNAGTTPQFSTATGAFSLSGTSYRLTTANSTVNGGNDQNDSDAAIASGLSTTAANGYPTICMITPDAGSNHTFDVGLISCTPPSVTALAASNTLCAGRPATLYAQVSPAGNYTYVVAGPTGVSLTGANTATAVATGLGTGINTFTITVSSSPSCLTTATVSVSVIAPPSLSLTSGTVCQGQPISLTASGAGAGATYVFSTTGAVGNVLTVRPVITTVYTVTGTTAGGCSATTSATVTVNDKPNAGTDQTLVCGTLGAAPTATTLMATPTGGSWSNQAGNPTVATFTPNAANTTVGNLAAGTYAFIYTAVNGCRDTVAVTVPICQTFCASFSATASASSYTTTTGSAVTLTAHVSPVGSYTYAWSSPAGIAVTPTNAATAITSALPAGVNTFTVTVTSSPGCFTTATVSVTVLTPALAVSVTPGICQTATNQYTVSGTISFSAAVASTLTITDGTVSATVAVTAGQPSAGFSLSGLISGSGSHTVTVSGMGYAPASTTYAAPEACTVAVALTGTPGACQPATNQYSLSGTLSLTNAVPGTAFIADGTSTTSISVSAGATSVPYTLAGLPSGTGSHTVTVSYAGQSASLTYTAPESCTLGVAFIITPGVCQSATNQYTLTGTLSLTNTPAGTATFTDGTITSSVSVSAGQPSVSFSLTGLASGTASHTVTASFDGQTQSLTYTAPASCTVGVAITVTPGMCSTLTNQYSISGALSLTNPVPGTATITDGAVSTTVAISAGDTSVPYSLTGLLSGTASHTVTVTYATKTSSATYAAPESCTVGISLSVSPGTCNTATNEYAISGIVSLTNGLGGTATITDGSHSATVAVGTGNVSVSYSLTGLTSGTNVHTVTVSYATKASSVTYTAPASCTASVALSVTDPGSCVAATNLYTTTGVVSFTNATAGKAVLTDGTTSTTITIADGQTTANYALTGLVSGSGSHTVTVTYNTLVVSATYLSPASCSVAQQPTYVIAKMVDLSQVEKGQVVTYTLSLTNTSSVALPALVLTDQLSTTAITFVGSATASAGTFTPGSDGGSWSLSGLAGGQTATLRYRVQLNQEGITYNTVTAPNGQTVVVCTTVPFRVCANESFAFVLSVPDSYSAYQWSFNGQPIAGATTNTISATALGEYTVTTDGVNSCPTGACCPFIIGAAGALPSLTAVTVGASCSGATPQADARITRVGSNTAAVSYNITKGSSFSAATPFFSAPQALSAVVGDVLLGGQPNPASPQDYTIRVYSSSGCFTDTVVKLLPSLCSCPPAQCIPIVVKKTRSQGKPL